MKANWVKLDFSLQLGHAFMTTLTTIDKWKHKMKQLFIFVWVIVFLAGCSNADYKTGTGVAYDSLADLRAANLAVRVYEELPAKAADIATLTANRCHRDWNDPAPTKETLITDLKINAYGLGYDGIKLLKIEKKSALMKNCWYMHTATAKAFRLSN